MSRELKFRGINIDTDKWVYGYGVIVCDDMAQIIHQQGINISQHTNVKPETVGQYTGLKDKNKVEIYEGDIIEVTERRYFFGYDKGLQTIRFRSPIVYEDATFCYSTTQENDSPLCVTDNIEVIGNIYQHPHLLNQPK